MAQLRATIHFNAKQEKKKLSHHHTSSPLPPDENDDCIILDNNDNDNRNSNDHNNITTSNNENDEILGEDDIEDGNTIAKTITTNEEVEAYFRTCERMIQEETIEIDENISNFIFLPAEDIFDLVGETEHPANNEDGKWTIKDLFKPLDIL